MVQNTRLYVISYIRDIFLLNSTILGLGNKKNGCREIKMLLGKKEKIITIVDEKKKKYLLIGGRLIFMGMGISAQCMYACTSPNLLRQSPNHCQEEVPYGE